MNIGFSTVFSYRPHVSNASFLIRQCNAVGHRVFVFECDGESNCHTQLTRPRLKKLNCHLCKIGALSTYVSKEIVCKSSSFPVNEAARKKTGFGSSSLLTVSRSSHINDVSVKYNSEELENASSRFYGRAFSWLIDKEIEFMFIFNGRMDLTYSLVEACRTANVKYCCIERPAFGKGIQINYGENCLGLRRLHDIVQKFKAYPLSEKQIHRVSKIIASRFSLDDSLEWRKYNTGEVSVSWPRQEFQKVLFLPSSLSEKVNHEDWAFGWESPLRAIECLFEKLELNYSNLIVRGHPGWSETVSGVSGENEEKLYRSWCLKKKVIYHDSGSKVSTRDLIKQADIIILCGSSAGFEAGLLGKKSISFSMGHYYKSGICDFILSENELKSFNLKNHLNYENHEILKLSLRFLYSYGFRFPSFLSSAQARNRVSYRYKNLSNVELKKLESLLNDGNVPLGDESISDCQKSEREFIEKLQNNLLQTLANITYKESFDGRKEYRRGLFKVIDPIRNLLKTGDRL